jgi:lysophospholipase L1-like esterase
MRTLGSRRQQGRRSSLLQRLHPGTTLLVFLIFPLISSGTVAQEKMLKPLRGVHRILFLGDSITHLGGYVDEIDLYLFTHFPDTKPDVINLGLPSETLSGLSEEGHAGGAFQRPDLHERLLRALDKVKPDLVVACYGMNDGIYYPFGRDRFRKFQDGYRKLESAVKQRKVSFWVFTPAPFDPLPLQGKTLPPGLTSYPSGTPYVGYDQVLESYSVWLVLLRKAGWNVIDLHGALLAHVNARRENVPGFTLSPDGVHPNALGHHLMAKAILRAWGARDKDAIEPNQEMLALVRERQNILKDAWLTEVGHKRPGMNKGMPLEQAQQKAAELEAKIRSSLRLRE